MTPKQEHFARLFVETGNASEAYRKAYNAENMKPETITNEAYKLLQDPDITAMIDGLKAEHRERHAVTVDDLIAELEQARQKALNAPTPQSGAAVSASMGKAKILGLIMDKSEVKAEVKAEVENADQFSLRKEFTSEQVAALCRIYYKKKKDTTIADLEAIVGKDGDIGKAAFAVYVQSLI